MRSRGAHRVRLLWHVRRSALALSAYRGSAILLKLVNVSIAAAQVISRLVGSLRHPPGFNAHGAERDYTTAIESESASREIARHNASTAPSPAVGYTWQHWAKAPNGVIVHDAASTVDPAQNPG